MDLDLALSWQLLTAWAGERYRLEWWDCNLLDEDGGLDVFSVNLGLSDPEWSAFRAAREAARRVDARRRAEHATPASLTTLFHWGVELDEQLDDRLRELRGLGRPREILSLLGEVLGDEDYAGAWDAEAFRLARPSAPETTQTTVGLRLKSPPEDPNALLRALVGAMRGDRYPMPYAEVRVAP
ncbi:MAG: BREX-6 system BrxE protein [Alphaproteobacteria bacterium]|nr:BREX-6 system BrxE protein [Alphaproteobacteria bacterium]